MNGKIWVVEDEAELDHLREDWNRLLQQSSSDTVFLTWEWATAWWRSYGAKKKLWILKVEKNGELVGLVPLYKSNLKFGFFHYRGLYLIGDGSWDSDYLDAIIKTGEEEFVTRSIVTFLLEHQAQWDLLFLNEVPEISLNLELFRRFFHLMLHCL